MIEIVYALEHKESPRDLVKSLKEEGIDAKLLREPSGTANLVIAWGKNVSGPAMNGDINRDKYSQLVKMRDAGVSVIEATKSLDEALEWLTQCPVFMREGYHERGNGLTVFLPEQGHSALCYAQKPSGVYYTKFSPSTEEWRFHIFEGLSIAAFVKQPCERTRIENLGAGSLSVDVLRATAKAAVAAVGYDFGAVDILGSGKVLEINTAPALDREFVMDGWVKAIKGKLR